MGIRNRRAVLEIAVQHFTEFKIPLNVDYKEYVAIVGKQMALKTTSVKRSFKRWPILLKAVGKAMPPAPPKPAPKPAAKPAPEVKAPAKPATVTKPKVAPKPKAAPVKKES